MEAHVWVARHGQRIDFVDTDWEATAERPYDPYLTPRGFQQATKTGEYLRESKSGVKRIISSPFLRCLQTSENIAKEIEKGGDEVTIHVDYSLCEWYGYFMTRPTFPSLEEMKQSFPHVSLRPYKDNFLAIEPNEVKFPESVPAMQDRFEKFLTQIQTNATNDERVLCVTHGYGIEMIIELLCPHVQIVETPECCLSQIVGTMESSPSNDGSKSWQWEAKKVTSYEHLAQL